MCRASIAQGLSMEGPDNRPTLARHSATAAGQHDIARLEIATDVLARRAEATPVTRLGTVCGMISL